jgi:hypothetical protein
MAAPNWNKYKGELKLRVLPSWLDTYRPVATANELNEYDVLQTKFWALNPIDRSSGEADTLQIKMSQLRRSWNQRFMAGELKQRRNNADLAMKECPCITPCTDQGPASWCYVKPGCKSPPAHPSLFYDTPWILCNPNGGANKSGGAMRGDVRGGVHRYVRPVFAYTFNKCRY